MSHDPLAFISHLEVDKARSILRFVSKKTSISQVSICSKIKKGEVVFARQLYCWLCMKLTKLSLANTGKVISENRLEDYDHATVLHSCRTIDNYIDTYKDKRIFIYECLDEAETQLRVGAPSNTISFNRIYGHRFKTCMI